MINSTILTTRSLTYVEKNGDVKEVPMILLKRIEEDGNIKCGVRLGAPINWEMFLGGSDMLHSIIRVLSAWWARLFLGGMPLAGNIRWQDSFHCGLPAPQKRPDSWAPPDIPSALANPGNLQVLSASIVSCPDESGAEMDLPLFVFVPSCTDDGLWQCGFTFGPKDIAPIRYGMGDDYIDSLLDAAAMIRVVYDALVPKGWKPTDPDKDCQYLPYKIGRRFFIDDPEADAPPDP